MRRYNIFKSIVVALVSAVSMTVAAEDVYIESTANGQINYSVSGSTVTLNVIPSNEYYITVDDIVVQKTIDGSAASRRGLGPNVADRLPVTPVDVDDTGKGTYTFSLIEGYGAYVTATFTECQSISPTVEIKDWVYGDTPEIPTVKGNVGNGDVIYYYRNVNAGDYGLTVPADAGEYRLYAAIAAKGHYKSAETAEASFSIEKAPLTITAKDYTIKQGEALPAFEAEYAGFKNNETSEVLTKQPTITTTATSASEPGEYDITVSGAEAQNYEMSYVKGKLTITEADPVTVTAKSYTIKYGDDIPAFEFTSDGAALEGTPLITCEATSASPVGTYPIVISKGSVANYNVTYVNGTLTIEKAPLRITAKDYTIKQGEALPAFEATYEGFKNNETLDVLTKQPTITTTATSASEPGEYEITVSGAEAQNYEMSYVAGKLTITEASGIIGISVDSPMDIYDLQGNKVRYRATSLEGLPKGVYIVNGKKVIVK